MIKKAIDRIFWRFGGNGNKKPFPVNDKDIEAYNHIEKYFQETQKQQYEANELFAKMYIYTAMKIMENDKSTVYDKNHQKKIGNLLKYPLSQLIENLAQSLNDSEMYSLLEDAGHDFKHPALRKEGEPPECMEKLQTLLKEPKNANKLYGKAWTYEKVKDPIMDEINNLINLYK
jgi:uncharacterized membrane protein YgaE (UPF0421/DUF939 family)